MTFQKKKTEYCTMSLTVKVLDRNRLYDEIDKSGECFTSASDFFRAAINLKLKAMGIEFRLT